MSSSAPSTAPRIITGTRSGRPKSHTIPAGRRTAFAPPKVAAEMTVCSRFCRAVLRKRRVSASGMRPAAMAMTAAMIELFALIPTRVSSSIPMMAPSRARPAPNSSVPGSNRLGCRLGSAMRAEVCGRRGAPASSPGGGLQTGTRGAPRRARRDPAHARSSERRPPAGIARERETRTDGTAVRPAGTAGLQTGTAGRRPAESRIATRSRGAAARSAGLWPASRGSAKPGLTAQRHARPGPPVFRPAQWAEGPRNRV